MNTAEKRRYAMLNKVMVIGRLIRDCEVRYLDSTNGNAPLQLTTFVLAMDGAANYGQEPAFLEFSHLGEFAVAEHLVKGRLIYVEGHITQQRKEIDGQRRTFTNFTCDRLQLLSARPEGRTDREEDFEVEDDGLPSIPAPKISPNSQLAQTLVNHYGAMEEWSGKQVSSLIRWLKDKSGVNAETMTLEGFRQQLEKVSADRAQEIHEDLTRAFAQKSA